MDEYIKRAVAVTVCDKQYRECLRKSDFCGDTVAWNICADIKAIPAADVAPVVHGQWVSVAGKRDRICSRCLRNEPYKNADDDAGVFEFARIVAQRWTEVTAMRLIDADTTAAFAENCGATFVAKRLRDSNAFPAVVTRCKDCKYAYINSFAVSSGEALCTLSGKPMQQDDFCSYGEPKEEPHADDHD